MLAEIGVWLKENLQASWPGTGSLGPSAGSAAQTGLLEGVASNVQVVVNLKFKFEKRDMSEKVFL